MACRREGSNAPVCKGAPDGGSARRPAAQPADRPASQPASLRAASSWHCPPTVMSCSKLNLLLCSSIASTPAVTSSGGRERRSVTSLQDGRSTTQVRQRGHHRQASRRGVHACRSPLLQVPRPHQCSHTTRAVRESRSSRMRPMRASPHGERYCGAPGRAGAGGRGRGGGWGGGGWPPPLPATSSAPWAPPPNSALSTLPAQPLSRAPLACHAPVLPAALPRPPTQSIHRPTNQPINRCTHMLAQLVVC